MIALLDARNQYFNSLVSIVSTRAVAVFADFQLLATMGHLLDYLKTAPPPEADPIGVRPFGLFPYKLPPVIIKDPDIAPEPLNVRQGEAPPAVVTFPPPPPPPQTAAIEERWPTWTTASRPSLWTKPEPERRSVVDNRWPDQSGASAFAQPAAKNWGPFKKD